MSQLFGRRGIQARPRQAAVNRVGFAEKIEVAFAEVRDPSAQTLLARILLGIRVM